MSVGWVWGLLVCCVFGGVMQVALGFAWAVVLEHGGQMFCLVSCCCKIFFLC